MKGGWGGGGLEQKVSTFLKNVRLSLFRCQLSEILFNFQLWGGGGSSRAGRREENFWNLRCDSLLPESISGCKSVEIEHNFPPPAGSFSEKEQKISASGGVSKFIMIK